MCVCVCVCVLGGIEPGLRVAAQVGSIAGFDQLMARVRS